MATKSLTIKRRISDVVAYFRKGDASNHRETLPGPAGMLSQASGEGEAMSEPLPWTQEDGPRENYLAEPTNAELDRIMAGVMGWEHKISESLFPANPGTEVGVDSRGLFVMFPIQWHPSTDVTQAMRCLKKVHDEGAYVSLDWLPSRPFAIGVRKASRLPWGEGVGEPARAICLAIYKALKEVENG